MSRALTYIGLILCSCLGQANQKPFFYQVDMIVFTHQQVSPDQTEKALVPLLVPEKRNAIPLQNTGSDMMTPYHTLPSSLSQLRQEYWALHRKPQYQVLLHYTWLQPRNSQRAVALPPISRGGWNIEGTMRIRQSNYYLLDTELLFSAPESSQTSFVFSQKQRLKSGVIYYLDHPQAGMLIKVHPVVT